jgi:hypothetical protein
VFEALLFAAAISLPDPAGDVVGAGSLQPPTAAVYRNLAPFDLRRVTIADGEQLTVEIEMGSLANPFELPLGFSLPVIELYIEGREGGETELLRGAGMNLPAGRTWEVALRLTGESAAAYRAGESGVENAVPEVAVEGNVLTVSTSFPRPRRPRVFAMVGLYDLFGSTPWRQVDQADSPWAFSSRTQRVPVVDLLARNSGVQSRAIEERTLPPSGERRFARGAVWLLLMALGLLVALLGIAMRAFGHRFGPAPGAEGERGDGADELPGDEAAGPEGRRPDDAALRAPAVPSLVPPAGDFVPDEDAWGGRGADVAAASDGEEGFTWDSSALLTEPHDEEPSEAFFPAEPVDRAPAWIRPVPLPLEDETAPAANSPANGAANGAEADDENHPEVVRDEEDQGDESQGADTPEASEANEDGPADGSAGEERRGRSAAGNEIDEQQEGQPGRERSD